MNGSVDNVSIVATVGLHLYHGTHVDAALGIRHTGDAAVKGNSHGVEKHPPSR